MSKQQKLDVSISVTLCWRTSSCFWSFSSSKIQTEISRMSWFLNLFSFLFFIPDFRRRTDCHTVSRWGTPAFRTLQADLEINVLHFVPSLNLYFCLSPYPGLCDFGSSPAVFLTVKHFLVPRHEEPEELYPNSVKQTSQSFRPKLIIRVNLHK